MLLVMEGGIKGKRKQEGKRRKGGELCFPRVSSREMGKGEEELRVVSEELLVRNYFIILNLL